MSLLCVGSVAHDLIEFPGRVPVRVLGGAATYASAAASLFTRPSLVAVVGDDFPAEDTAFLLRRGIDTTGLIRRPGRTFFWHGRYHEDMTRRESLVTELGVFADFDPVIPERVRRPDILLLGNIKPSLQRLVLERVEGRPFTGLDTIEIWIRNDLVELTSLMPSVDLMFANDEEVKAITGETGLTRAARRILALGADAVAVKLGPHGSMLFAGDRFWQFPGWPVEEVMDTTGAGDSYAGAIMGFLDRVGQCGTEALCTAMAVGTVVASLKVEGCGPMHFDTITGDMLTDRMRRYAEMVRFDAAWAVGVLEDSAVDMP